MVHNTIEDSYSTKLIKSIIDEYSITFSASKALAGFSFVENVQIDLDIRNSIIYLRTLLFVILKRIRCVAAHFVWNPTQQSVLLDKKKRGGINWLVSRHKIICRYAFKLTDRTKAWHFCNALRFKRTSRINFNME